MRKMDVSKDNRPSLSQMNEGNEKNQSCNHNIDFLMRLSNSINLYFPAFWVLVAQLLMVFLLLNETAVGLLNELYDSVLTFTRINSRPPFSTPLAKAYTALLVFLIPVQLASLLMVGQARVMGIVRKTNRKDFVASFIFVFLMCIVFAFFFRLGNYGPLRLLGGGVFAASLATPCITSIFSLMFAMAYFIVTDK